MSKITDTIIEELYAKSVEKILQVYEVFKDFFDEDRVDLQGLESLETFKDIFKRQRYNYFLTRTNIFESQRWSECSIQEKEIVKALLSEGALSTYMASDELVLKYLYPFLMEIYRSSNPDAYIIVRFPNLRVSNENDKYVDIKELYARIKVSSKGMIIGTFGLLRTDYPLSHLYADYAHSHVNGVTLDYQGFKSPCLGTGPINRTITSLSIDFDLNMWMLFCRELDTYVVVESLAGVPYRHLEGITGKRKINSYQDSFSNSIPIGKIRYWNGYLRSEELIKFITHLLTNRVIKFNFINNSYHLAMSYKDFMVDVSNAFIDYVNNVMKRTDSLVDEFSLTRLLETGKLKQYVIKNGFIYSFSHTSASLDSYRSCMGKRMLTFKGEDVRLNIYEDTDTEVDNVVYLLDPIICEFILANILIYLNYIYGKESSNTQVRSCKKCIIL